MPIKIDPPILSIKDELAFSLTNKLDLASTTATNTYHRVSINPAIATITDLSKAFISFLINWLKTAAKNTNIFGFRNEIIKPSKNPFGMLFFCIFEKPDEDDLIIKYPMYISHKAPKIWMKTKKLWLAIIIEDNPMTAIEAYMVSPIPWPIPVKIPCFLPPSMVFLITTARLGPGEIAPEAQMNAKIIIDWKSKLIKSKYYLNRIG